MAMLTAYRRHIKNCAHKQEGRKYRRCRCPIWMDGYLGSVEIRKSLETRDWEKAQQFIRACEAEGAPTVQKRETTIEQACLGFENDAAARGLRESTLKKYRVLFAQLRAFADNEGLILIKQFDLAALRRFRESWRDGGISASKKLERLRALFRFVHEAGWIGENPAYVQRRLVY